MASQMMKNAVIPCKKMVKYSEYSRWYRIRVEDNLSWGHHGRTIVYRAVDLMKEMMMVLRDVERQQFPLWQDFGSSPR